MRIPSSFRNKIKDVFYDKELVLYTISTFTDNEGFVSEDIVEFGRFFGNVQYDRLDQIREEYGLKEDIDVTITTDNAVANNYIVGYKDELFRIVKSIPYDSHYFLLGKKYEQSSNSPSA